MKCPACETQLTMSERQGIQVNACPICRGMWLEPCELEALLQRGGHPPRLAADWDHCATGARPGLNNEAFGGGASGLKRAAPLPRHLACSPQGVDT